MKRIPNSNEEKKREILDSLFDQLAAAGFTTKEYFVVLLILSVTIFIHVVLTISIFILPGE
ncbi:MAG: hypothetical protein GPJ54_02785 [Candidatus Heimdallarchaeota archaeon]|nr:hypothetical protein [Candidatus Heimdallarchaeota archaeon]